MSPEDRSLILQIVGLIVTAVLGYLVKRQGDKSTIIEKKVDDVVLKFDPITHTLDGQLTAIKETIRSEANLQARSDLLEEQRVQAVTTAAAVAASQVIAQVVPSLPELAKAREEGVQEGAMLELARQVNELLRTERPAPALPAEPVEVVIVADEPVPVTMTEETPNEEGKAP